MARFATCKLADLLYWRGKSPAKVGGLIVSVAEKTTKKGDLMAQLVLEDSDGSFEMVVFPRKWAEVKSCVTVGLACIVEGRMGDREPRNFIVDALTPLDEAAAKEAGLVRIRLRTDLIGAPFNVKDFAMALRDCRGNSPVLLELADDKESCVLSLADYRVESGAAKLLERLGEVVPLAALEVVC